ncbi:MAG: hypothetical protein RL662_1534, partial [Bacteroidota bacterium]
VDNKEVEYTFEPLVGNDIPNRLYYPTKEQNVNGKSYREALAHQGSDNLETKLWLFK